METVQKKATGRVAFPGYSSFTCLYGVWPDLFILWNAYIVTLSFYNMSDTLKWQENKSETSESVLQTSRSDCCG